jgi:hypothetical protein
LINIFLRKVRAEEKESKNLFAVIRAEEKEKSTHHSSRNRAVAVGERREKEERKTWRHHFKHQSYVYKKNAILQYCKMLALLN